VGEELCFNWKIVAK